MLSSINSYSSSVKHSEPLSRENSTPACARSDFGLIDIAINFVLHIVLLMINGPGITNQVSKPVLLLLAVDLTMAMHRPPDIAACVLV